MYEVLRDFVGDEAGSTAVDYGLMAAIVVAVAFSAFAALGEGFPGFLNHVGCMVTNSPECGTPDF